jgi:hypothetical protein
VTPRPEVPRASTVDPLVETLPAGTMLVQVFPRRRGALTFNPSDANGRFRPLSRSDGTVEPTAYLASDQETALAEAVLRGVTALDADDVPRRLYRRQLTGLSVVEAVVRRPIRVARLHGAGLVRLGLRRGGVIDCEELDYPYTAAWAQSLWGCRRRPAGISWTSRQNDSGRAIVLWQSRIRDDALAHTGFELELDREPGIDRVRTACVAAGVDFEG